VKEPKIYVVTDAVNRKNGGNGSMLDLVGALDAPTIVFRRRGAVHGYLEAWRLGYLNVLPFSKIKKINTNTSNCKRTIVFCIASTEVNELSTLRSVFKEAEIYIFQTGDVGLNDRNQDKYRIVDGVIFQSPEHLRIFNDVYSNLSCRCILLRPTINERRYQSFKETIVDTNGFNWKQREIIRLAIIGSVQPRKNQVYAILLCNELKKLGIPVHLSIIGPLVDQKYLQEIRRTIATCNLQGNVEILGFKSNYEKYLISNDIILSVSLEEGVATILRETLYLGKLAIVSDIAGNKGTFNHENSIIINIDDSPEDNAGKIFSILEDEKNLVEITANARKTYKKFHAQKIFRQTLNSLVNDHG